MEADIASNPDLAKDTSYQLSTLRMERKPPTRVAAAAYGADDATPTLLHACMGYPTAQFEGGGGPVRENLTRVLCAASRGSEHSLFCCDGVACNPCW